MARFDASGIQARTWSTEPQGRATVGRDPSTQEDGPLTEADQESNPCGCSPGVHVKRVVVRKNDAMKPELPQGVGSLVLPACMALWETWEVLERTHPHFLERRWNPLGTWLEPGITALNQGRFRKKGDCWEALKSLPAARFVRSTIVHVGRWGGEGGLCRRYLYSGVSLFYPWDGGFWVRGGEGERRLVGTRLWKSSSLGGGAFCGNRLGPDSLPTSFWCPKILWGLRPFLTGFADLSNPQSGSSDCTSRWPTPACWGGGPPQVAPRDSCPLPSPFSHFSGFPLPLAGPHSASGFNWSLFTKSLLRLFSRQTLASLHALLLRCFPGVCVPAWSLLLVPPGLVCTVSRI